jgi:hypothetical protein
MLHDRGQVSVRRAIAREFYYERPEGPILFEFESEAVTCVARSDLLANRRRCWNAHRREPVVAIRLFAAGEREEFVLDFLGDRSAGAVAYRDAVD